MPKVNLDEVIGLCRFCTKPLGNSPPPACADCIKEGSRRTTHVRESDPYLKVWNTVESEESSIAKWMDNGALFAPTYEELARRHVSTAQYHLAKARGLGRSAGGIAAFEVALLHRGLAKECFDRNREILILSR